MPIAKRATVAVDGKLLTLEIDPAYAAVARQNLAHAGVGDIVDVLVGPALTILRGLQGPFDFAFLDADKATLDEQLELVLPLLRPGALIVCDSVVRGGAINHRPEFRRCQRPRRPTRTSVARQR